MSDRDWIALWRSGQYDLALCLPVHLIVFTWLLPVFASRLCGVTFNALGGAVRPWAPPTLYPPALLAEEI